MHLPLAPCQWTLRVADGDTPAPAAVRDREIPAVVPGCVHTDLIRADLIEHPDRGFAERDDAWIGRTDWLYHASFVVPPALLDAGRLDLVCDGLDTVAEIAVNGINVGVAANMHHPHRFDVRAAVRAGRNDIAIAFRGPLAFVEEQERERGERPVNGDWGPYAYARKAACHFGWDWGPCAPSAGIWRDIRLEAWSGARLRGVRPLVEIVHPDLAVIDVVADIEREDDATEVSLNVRLVGPDGAVAASGRASSRMVTLEIDHPALWWPRGHGGQPRYELHLELRDAAGAPLDRWASRIGLRQVRLLTTPDEDDRGAGFALAVNGRPIFCLGANWIPDTLFPTETTPARVRTRIEQAAAANMNMLRVWGGGVYEDDVFYETCDELGVMVWQDFMLACATYPEEPPYPALIEAEARHQVTRLCRHPCVVLWCGGNENVIAYESWGWKERIRPGQTWGERYYLEWLPRVVADLDPTRPFWPDSPWSGARAVHPNDPDRGDRHTWDLRGEGYRDLVPRFVSEFGHQSPPAWSTLRRAVGDAGLAIDSDAMRHRQRAGGGNDRQYGEPIAASFLAPETFDDWHYLAQLVQARSIALGVEWLRANRPRCMGALIWQHNDCWSGHSWSAIDAAGRRKPLWYALRRSFASRLLTIHPVAGRPTLFAANDAAEAWSATATTRRVRFDGAILREETVTIRAPGGDARAIVDLEALLGPPVDPASEMIVVDAGRRRACWCHLPDKDLALPPPRFAAKTTRNDGSLELSLTAETVLRDVVLAVDRLDPAAEIDDHLVTVLPGETVRFRIQGAPDVALERLTTPPVFNCANRFARR